MAKDAAAERGHGGKIELGQFYTIGNPFNHPRMTAWLQARGVGCRWLEPFAGANNIVMMVQEILPGVSFTSYDIEPGAKGVRKRDTLGSYPRGFDVVVTNPPYLARNSARRRGYNSALATMGEWEDLYLKCLETCLKGTKFVAAIIPESFITSGKLRERLEFVVSLNEKMFDDTEHPVCLAVFGEKASNDFEVWVGDELIGLWSQIAKDEILSVKPLKMKFNDKKGSIGLQAVDNTKGPSIRFVEGRNIPAGEIKHSSRHRTRIRVPQFEKLDREELVALIETANQEIEAWRGRTGDVLMSPFMGLREDGVYRRRLDYATGAKLLTWAAKQHGVSMES
jgi:hypothetical protein